MAVAYEGNKPYIFISYSHKDTELVTSAINALQNDGFAVWFDAGIEAGSEWPEYIATHLRNSACMLTFISENFVESDNCRRELNFAQDIKKPLLNIYISDVELSDGMKMQLGLNQALYRSKFANDNDFFKAICNARLILPCKVIMAMEKNNSAEDITGSDTALAKTNSEQDPDELLEITRTDPREAFYAALESELRGKGLHAATVRKKMREYREYLGALSEEEAAKKIESLGNVSAIAENVRKMHEEEKAKKEAAQEVKKETADKKSAPEPSPHPGKKKALSRISALIELSYIFIGTFAIDKLTGMDLVWWKLLLLMIIPHTALMLLTLIIFRTTGKELTNKEKDDALLAPFVCLFPASIIAVIAGAFKVHTVSNVILKLLISLGLNIIPTVIAFCIIVGLGVANNDK